jgi:hypothetical protein
MPLRMPIEVLNCASGYKTTDGLYTADRTKSWTCGTQQTLNGTQLIPACGCNSSRPLTGPGSGYIRVKAVSCAGCGVLAPKDYDCPK